MAKRGRKKGSKNKKIKVKTARKQYIKKVKSENVGKIFLDLTCRVCKETIPIRINNPEIYTKEIRKNWLCSKRKCREEGGKK